MAPDRYTPLMPPMVERELRMALFRRGARRQWIRTAWIAGGISMFFLLVSGTMPYRVAGKVLFEILFALGCTSVLMRGLGLTADLFSEERRNGTLGLLVLTGLTPLEIFANKLSGAVVLASYGLIGAMPFFALPFLAGGVSAAQFVCTLVFLTNALLFCVAIGLLTSVLHRDSGQAQTTALALAALFSFAAPALYWVPATLGVHTIGRGWMISSPAYAGYLAFRGLPAGTEGLFWETSAVTICYSAIALLAAAAILNRTWRDGPEVLVPASWRKRFGQWLVSGNSFRSRLRKRLLETSPFAWLAARDKVPIVAGHALLVSGVIVWGLLWYAAGSRWVTPRNVFCAALVLHQLLNFAVSYAAAKRFGEERQTGGFEILLTTPLRVNEIVEGQNKGLVVQFKTVFLFALLFDFGLMASAFTGPLWTGSGVITYVLGWAMLLFLCYGMHLETAMRAMWISAWTGRPGYAALHAMRPNVWTLVYLLVVWSNALGRHPQQQPIGVGFFAFLLLAAAFGTFSRRGELREKLNSELRDIAAAPIPSPKDRRFSKWNLKQIYPPGRWGYLDLRPVQAEVKVRMNRLWPEAGYVPPTSPNRGARVGREK